MYCKENFSNKVQIVRPLIIFLILTFSLSVFADYAAQYIELKIKTINGQCIQAFDYGEMIYQKDKSMDYKSFLEHNYQSFLADNDSLFYYENRIRYDYKIGSDDSLYIFKVINPKKIASTTIQAIEVLDIRQFSYATNISTPLTLQDTEWIQTQKVQTYETGGVFCHHQIFLHETNKKTAKIIAELKRTEQTYLQKVKELKEEMKYVNGEPYQEIQAFISKLDDQIDSKISAILEKFYDSKVVIISMCSC